ncbi:hypothetical protein [Paenibacillus radicis (ex Gao et al. 2016)]|uniref:Uncharacterized protein n=1 Tax=Paenibacillus radicis (ex Gao et al. 2016) TaxID=1737354 RepID=A0A917H1Y6_9BACL|nr:hypothetical protein [Paenibacillus radicis (ex Gao et al. 2016)]GGG64983.1 hypothetical protein GCM10010918_18890 [Paenibacillus radicis (ex Gao et al. 2016)]
MTEYNLDLERQLQERPLPAKQVQVSLESITAEIRPNRNGRSRWLLLTSAAAIVLVITAGLWAGDMTWKQVDHIPPADSENQAGVANQQNSSPIKDLIDLHRLTSDEWKSLLSGTSIDPSIELLHQEKLTDDTNVVFFINQLSPNSEYQIVVANVRQSEEGEYKSVSMTSTNVSKQWTPGPFSEGNAYFLQMAAIGREGSDPLKGQLIGIIRDSKVAAIRMTNEVGDHVDADVIQSASGDSFFFGRIPDSWLEGLRRYMDVSALDNDGAELKTEKHYL